MKKIKKFIYAIIIAFAILIILIIFLTWAGFNGLGHNKSIKNISTDNRQLIAESFNITLDSNETISKFERNEYYSDTVYAITIKGVYDIESFKERNENIRYYTKKGSLLRKSSYRPVGSYKNCFYNDNTVVVSLYTFSKDYDKRIGEIFYDLSD